MLLVKAKDNRGRDMNITFQSAGVRKPLLSISKICKADHKVEFRSDGGTIFNTKTGRQTELAFVNGVYALDLWVLPFDDKTNNSSGFTRPGM